MMTFERSSSWRARATRVIPAGAHTYSKGDDQFPLLSPGFIARGCGSHVWDVDGNEFIDWGMGLRSVVLGHAFEPVLQAVREQLTLGANFTRPSPIEVEVAELIADTIPCAEMVKFAKNGSDVTTAAVRLARAFTGRDLVARCQDHPFFSVDDWFIGDTACAAGIPAATQALTKRFAFNDLASLQRLFAEHPNQIACVILEAAARVEPVPGFLQDVKTLCERHGALLILDEIITGFRWGVAGAQAYYDVKPDLATFGKAAANGFSCSFLAGRRDVMRLGGLDHDRVRVFLLSTTHGGETHALAAARATMFVMKNEPVIDHLWHAGRRLIDGFNDAARALGIESRAQVGGVPCSPVVLFLAADKSTSLPLQTLFSQEMIRRGVLIPWIAPCWSHNDEDVDRTVDAASQALRIVKRAIENDSTDGLLVGPAIKPVFRKYN